MVVETTTIPPHVTYRTGRAPPWQPWVDTSSFSSKFNSDIDVMSVIRERRDFDLSPENKAESRFTNSPKGAVMLTGRSSKYVAELATSSQVLHKIR